MTLDSPLMDYWIGKIGTKLSFTRRWSNRKHTVDSDEYFAYSWPMAPYQTQGDYIKYGLELYFGFPMSNMKPYLGVGSEFKIEQISSNYIYLDNQTDAEADPYQFIPIDEHVERRFNYYAIGAVDIIIARYF